MATPANATTDVESAITSAPPLPPASTFDILPPLHQLLSRLLAQSSALPIPPADGQEGVLQIVAPIASDPAALTYKDLQPLEIQHLAQEAAQIKIRIQKARQAVKGLPDMDRTVEDQKEEVEDLEARCEQLRKVLQGMAGRVNNGEPAAQNGAKRRRDSGD